MVLALRRLGRVSPPEAPAAPSRFWRPLNPAWRPTGGNRHAARLRTRPWAGPEGFAAAGGIHMALKGVAPARWAAVPEANETAEKAEIGPHGNDLHGAQVRRGT